MPLSMNGTVFEGVSVLAQPNSYIATSSPENMQSGTTAVIKGELVKGTGKCFVKAGYGQSVLSPVFDMDGNEKQGISIFTKTKPNIVVIGSTNKGDIVLQENFIFAFVENETQTIGSNYSQSSKVYAYYDGIFLNIYFEDTKNTETELIYFYGKDAYI